MTTGNETKLKAYAEVRSSIEADLRTELERRLKSAREALGLTAEDVEKKQTYTEKVFQDFALGSQRLRKLSNRGGQVDRVKAALNVMPKQFKINDLMNEIIHQAPELASKRRSIATYIWKRATNKAGLKIADRGEGSEGNTYEKL